MQYSHEEDSSLIFSESTNLLEQSAYKYQLQDREEPNLYRHLFDYESVPKVSFNHRFVPMCMPDKIWITDTTFRDGAAINIAVHRKTDSRSLHADAQARRT